jgi:uncharacterized protein YegJ (DUF2314 family)
MTEKSAAISIEINRNGVACNSAASKYALLLLAVLLSLFTACSKKDKTFGVAADDAEMTAAIAKARASLPQFWEVFDKHERGESDFSLKVKITDKHGTEHFWTADIKRDAGKIMGTIDNDPDVVANVKRGDRIEIPEADISDWFYMRDGKMVGNRTLVPLLKSMPPKEAEFYKKLLAEP